MRYKVVLANLKDPENPDFRREVLLGHIKPEKVVNMTIEEMASDLRLRVISTMGRERDEARLKTKRLNHSHA